MILQIERSSPCYLQGTSYVIRSNYARGATTLPTTDQKARIAKALAAKKLTPSQASVLVAGEKVNNRFSRAGKLSLEDAEFLAGLTGHRAGWLLWGELPEKAGAEMASLLREARMAGRGEAYRAIIRVSERLAELPTLPLTESDEAGFEELLQLASRPQGKKRRQG